MDVPVFQLLVLFVLALAGLAVVMGVVARAFQTIAAGSAMPWRPLRSRLAGPSVYRLAGVRGRAEPPMARWPSVWGEDGYVWTWLARSFENIMSEFLQLAAFVVLTAFLIFEGSAESKDGDERLEAKGRRHHQPARRDAEGQGGVSLDPTSPQARGVTA